MEQKKGKFIVFEGIDGAGTTTQAKLLTKRLISDRQRAMFTFEPSDRFIGSNIRRYLKLERKASEQLLALMFAADRLDHYENVIKPILETGINVICDRYIWSSLVYQTLNLNTEREEEWIQSINSYAVLPDITIYLRVSIYTASKRRERRSYAKELFEKDELLRKAIDKYETLLNDNYRRAILNNSFNSFYDIDGEQSIEKISDDIFSLIF